MAEWSGHTWFSLEHDGLGVGLSGNTDEREAAEAATKWSSRALGYTQTVNAKPMPTQGQREKWVWARQGQAPKVVPIPATKQSESILSTLNEAHRTHTEAELELDVLLIGPSSENLQIRDWVRTKLEGSFEDKLWRLGMLVERGYTSTSHNPRQSSRSQSIIHTSLATRYSTQPTTARTGGELRTRGGTRSTTQATQSPAQQPGSIESPNAVATDQRPQPSADTPQGY